SPALPAGLTLNTTTGVISGTPMAVTAPADYTVTATNAAGMTTVDVNITVDPRDLTINTNGSLDAGTYDNITINSPAVVDLLGNISVNGCITINGTLNMSSSIVSGPGCFTVGTGATLGIGSPLGITNGANGNVQV